MNRGDRIEITKTPEPEYPFFKVGDEVVITHTPSVDYYFRIGDIGKIKRHYKGNIFLVEFENRVALFVAKEWISLHKGDR